MENGDSWLARLASGDLKAAENLWEVFFKRIHAYAALRLRNLPPSLGDADDIAVSVFRSICRMAQNGAIPSVCDAEQLWPLLATIASRKLARLVRKARPNRKGQQIRTTDLDALGVSLDEVPILDKVLGREPSPELIVEMSDLWAEVLKQIDAGDGKDAKLRSVAELWLDGKTIAEIAELTTQSARGVSRKIAVIKRHLQELSGEVGEEN